MKLYGRTWTHEELRRRCGRMEQIAGVTRARLQDGPQRDVEVCDARTGSGFRFCVLPSRGLDISFAEHNGRALCWNSSTGFPHPHTFEATNFGWLRGFGGGLLTTCGLQSFGPENSDEGENFGIHDRVSYLPASDVRATTQWNEDGGEIVIEGTLRQTRVFGANLRLDRRISAHVGDNHLTVHDSVTNDGFEAAPMTILYHCNFGFPVVDEGAILQASSRDCQPRDNVARAGLENWAQMEAPQNAFAEQCFFHAMTPDQSGWARAQIWNPNLNFGAYVRYRCDSLPFLTQWKMMSAGNYVCGLEPSNAPLLPRNELRRQNQLPMLEAGETRQFEIELGIVESA